MSHLNVKGDSLIYKEWLLDYSVSLPQCGLWLYPKVAVWLLHLEPMFDVLVGSIHIDMFKSENPPIPEHLVSTLVFHKSNLKNKNTVIFLKWPNKCFPECNTYCTAPHKMDLSCHGYHNKHNNCIAVLIITMALTLLHFGTKTRLLH